MPPRREQSDSSLVKDPWLILGWIIFLIFVFWLIFAIWSNLPK